ncbi:MAG: DUF488 domain-containing protein [Acidimicrobiales bacterium]
MPDGPVADGPVADGPEVRIARVYDEPEPGALHVLVDRLWPRGISKAEAPFEMWAKDVAPSTELRKWYGHVPERFGEFAVRYRAELTHDPGRTALASLREKASGPLVLVTATKDIAHSGAAVLQAVLAGREPPLPTAV